MIQLIAFSSLDDITSGFVQIPVGVDLTITEARVDLQSATIRGFIVNIESTSDSSDLYSNQTGGLGEAVQEYIGSLSFLAGVAVSEATAEVVVNGGSIRADNDLFMTAVSETDSEVRTISVIIALAYGSSTRSDRYGRRDALALSRIQSAGEHVLR